MATTKKKTSIRFNFSCSETGSIMQFKSHQDTKFEECMKMYCKRQGIENRSEYKFLHEGQPITPELKPSGIELEDLDTIYVYKRQIGGN